MSLEQAVKDLQAQNAQLMTLIDHLAKGQEEIKGFITEKDMSPSAKKHPNATYGQKKGNHGGAILIPTSAPQRTRQQQGNQQSRGQRKFRRNFDHLPMPRTQILQRLIERNLAYVRPPTGIPNPIPPTYNVNARCAYHSNSPGHDTENCLTLKYKIQDLIDAGEIEFDPPMAPDATNVPMPRLLL